jgi:hypothetical protein
MQETVKGKIKICSHGHKNLKFRHSIIYNVFPVRTSWNSLENFVWEFLCPYQLGIKLLNGEECYNLLIFIYVCITRKGSDSHVYHVRNHKLNKCAYRVKSMSLVSMCFSESSWLVYLNITTQNKRKEQFARDIICRNREFPPPSNPLILQNDTKSPWITPTPSVHPYVSVLIHENVCLNLHTDPKKACCTQENCQTLVVGKMLWKKILSKN